MPNLSLVSSFSSSVGWIDVALALTSSNNELIPEEDAALKMYLDELYR